MRMRGIHVWCGACFNLRCVLFLQNLPVRVYGLAWTTEFAFIFVASKRNNFLLSLFYWIQISERILCDGMYIKGKKKRKKKELRWFLHALGRPADPAGAMHVAIHARLHPTYLYKINKSTLYSERTEEKSKPSYIIDLFFSALYCFFLFCSFKSPFCVSFQCTALLPPFFFISLIRCSLSPCLTHMVCLLFLYYSRNYYCTTLFVTLSILNYSSGFFDIQTLYYVSRHIVYLGAYKQ